MEHRPVSIRNTVRVRPILLLPTTAPIAITIAIEGPSMQACTVHQARMYHDDCLAAFSHALCSMTGAVRCVERDPPSKRSAGGGPSTGGARPAILNTVMTTTSREPRIQAIKGEGVEGPVSKSKIALGAPPRRRGRGTRQPDGLPQRLLKAPRTTPPRVKGVGGCR